ncbi:MAG: hypothetical protein ACYDC1_07510 [Limisphaerales bacterium]
MKKAFQRASLAIALIALSLWFFAGANFGWTRTSVPVKTLDEITGLEGIAYEKRWVPGIELLGAALVLSGSLVASSLLFSRKPRTSNE